MRNAFWIVWCPTGAKPPRVQHPTFGGAKTAAAEMAQQHPGHEFYVMGAAGVAVVPEPVVWEDIDSEIPF